jgi:hypothetical protein
VRVDYDDVDPLEAEDNAFLVAAAPDMYAALNEVKAWFQVWQQDLGPAEDKLFSVIDAAIAKAEGL